MNGFTVIEMEEEVNDPPEKVHGRIMS